MVCTYSKIDSYFSKFFKDGKYTVEGAKKISELTGLKKKVVATLFLDKFFSDRVNYSTIRQVQEETDIPTYIVYEYLKSHNIPKNRKCKYIDKKGPYYITGATLELDKYFKEHKCDYSNVEAAKFAKTTKQYVLIYMRSRGIPTYYEVRKLDKFFSERHQFIDLDALSKRLGISQDAIEYYINMRHVKIYKYKKGYCEAKPI